MIGLPTSDSNKCPPAPFPPATQRRSTLKLIQTSVNIFWKNGGRSSLLLSRKDASGSVCKNVTPSSLQGWSSQLEQQALGCSCGCPSSEDGLIHTFLLVSHHLLDPLQELAPCYPFLGGFSILKRGVSFVIGLTVVKVPYYPDVLRTSCCDLCLVSLDELDRVGLRAMFHLSLFAFYGWASCAARTQFCIITWI